MLEEIRQTDEPVAGSEIAALRCYQTSRALQLLALIQHDAMPMVQAEIIIGISLTQNLIGDQYNIEASHIKFHTVHFGSA